MRLELAIQGEAKRLIWRHEAHWQHIAEEFARQRKRVAVPPQRRAATRPEWWQIDRGFDPYATRTSAQGIAYSIRNSLRRGTYVPRAPVEQERPKPAGGTRTVSIYQVADSAVSKLVFESALKKNGPILGPRAYAYRKDINSQDAIQYIKSSFKGNERLYIAEYDFKAFFDNIAHDHVLKILMDRFLLTTEERSVVTGFLRTGGLAIDRYDPQGKERVAGIPQGTSVSLILANAAAWNLDRLLEGCGVNFVRYADDTLIWGPDYARVTEAVALLHQSAKEMGVDVNSAKSPGINLLVSEGSNAEMSSKSTIDFLGYRIGLDTTGIRDKAVARIKSRTVKTIYRNLLSALRHGNQNLGRLTGNDQDYVTCIWQLRRYLYGDLSEKALRRYQRREVPLRRFKGVMSAYPMIDDLDVLKELDVWLSSQLWLALRQRGKLLRNAGAKTLPYPHGASRRELCKAVAVSSRTSAKIDLTIPSFTRIAELQHRAIGLHGLNVADAVDDYDYY